VQAEKARPASHISQIAIRVKSDATGELCPTAIHNKGRPKMFANQFAGAIACAQFSDLNALAQQLWKAHAAGNLSDDEAQAFAEFIQAKKGGYQHIGGGAGNGCTGFSVARAALPKHKIQRSPDKQASIERRRRLARASPVPPELVDQFTQGEHAVITVVAGEIQRAGACTWCLDRIAAVAGVCKTLVRDAIRKARNVGLLFSIERRRGGQKSLTNVVRVLRRSWGAWLQRIGCRKTRSTMDVDSKSRTTAAVESFKQGVGGVGLARSVPRSPP
jgi:hypothetical protein